MVEYWFTAFILHRIMWGGYARTQLGGIAGVTCCRPSLSCGAEPATRKLRRAFCWKNLDAILVCPLNGDELGRSQADVAQCVKLSRQTNTPVCGIMMCSNSRLVQHHLMVLCLANCDAVPGRSVNSRICREFTSHSDPSTAPHRCC
jgi:hypothetical protein